MARFRKLDVRVWADSKFRDLSSPGPSGKYLWFFLLTGPHTTNIPGLFRAGEMALAEELGWSIEGFRKVFVELFSKGLVRADWKARVVWVPNAIKYNSPENPNVVKSWRTTWDEIPECSLKTEANARLKEFTKGLGEGFAKAFGEACVKSLANQEQEQEQKQKQEQEQKKIFPPALTRKLVKQKSPDPIVLKIYEKYPRKVARAAAYKAIDKAIARVAKEKSCSREDAADFIYQAVVKFRESPCGQKGEHTPHPATFMNQDRFFDDPQEWWKVNTNGNSSNSTGQDVIGDVAARLAQEVA